MLIKKIKQEHIHSLIEELPERPKDVIVRRFGIGRGEKETLESIGQSYGVTRERVRQIQQEALDKLRSLKSYEKIAKPTGELIESFLIEHGGLMRETRLAHQILQQHAIPIPEKHQGFIYLVLTITEPFQRSSENERFHPYWHIHDKAVRLAQEMVDKLVEYFEQEQKVVHRNMLLERVREQFPFISEKAVHSYLDISKEVERNPFDEVGLAWWPQVSPRGARDRAYLVLKRANQPMHFREIADAINEAGLSRRPARSQTVHNELIKDSRFVLVGRGKYALREWGYQPGTVKDVLVRVVNNKKPLHQDEIIKKVLKERLVKPGTIKFNLKSCKEFKEVKPGYYICVSR